MTIETLYIKSFGKLSGRTVNFGPGINIIEGANESGKTTVAAFIKFMFYGLSGRSSGALKSNEGLSERDRYLSWNGGSAIGAMVLSHGGRRYRIERELLLGARGAPRETVKIFDEVTSEVVSGEPDKLFLGVPESVYQRTAFVSQEEGALIGGGEMRDAIENIVFSADEAVNTKKALAKLDDARTILYYKNRKGGKLHEVREDKSRLLERYEQAKKSDEEIREKSKLHKEHSAQLAKNSDRLAAVSAKLAGADNAEGLRMLRQARRLRGEIAEIDAKLAELKRVGGDKIDRTYIDDIKSTTTKIELLEEQIAALNAERDIAASTVSGIAATDSSIDVSAINTQIIDPPPQIDDESANTVKSSASRARAMGLSSRLITIALAIGAVALALFGAVLAGNENKAPTVILFALCGIVLIATAYMLTRTLRYFGEYRTILATYGAADERELAEIFDRIAAEREIKKEAGATLDLADGKLGRLNLDVAALFEHADGLLARLEDKHNDGAVYAVELRALALRAETILAALDKLRSAGEARHDTLVSAGLAQVDVSEAAENRLLALIEESGEQSKNSLTPEEYNRVVTERNFLTKSVEGLTKQVHELEVALADIRGRSEQPIRVGAQLEEVSAKEAKYRAAFMAYELAYAKLSEASATMRGGIAPKLSSAASDFMRRATGERYRSIGVNDDYGLTFRSEDGTTTRSVEYLSAGTQDLLYVSLRVALVGMLYENPPAIIFDESFSRLDDERLSRALALLYTYSVSGGQVILLTSLARDAKILGKLETTTVVRL